MKKYMSILFALSLFITLLGFNVNSASAADLPDLIINDVVCSPLAPKGLELINCDVTVYNNSAVNINTRFNVNINGSLAYIDSLAAYSKKTVNTQYPFSLSLPGPNDVNFLVDWDNMVPESNEYDNNQYKKIITVQLTFSGEGVFNLKHWETLQLNNGLILLADGENVLGAPPFKVSFKVYDARDNYKLVATIEKISIGKSKKITLSNDKKRFMTVKVNTIDVQSPGNANWTANVTVKGDATPYIDISSPDGGENYKIGDSILIKFKASNFPSNSTVYIELRPWGYDSTGQQITTKIASVHPSNVDYTWLIPDNIGPGSYRIELYQGDKNGNIDPNGLAKDISYDSFTITSRTPQPCNASNSPSPVICGVSGPQSLNVNQEGRWTVTAVDRNGGNLSYSVIWGDETEKSPAYNRPEQTATFNHSYARAGVYTPTFTVTNNIVCITAPCPNSASTSLSVNVGSITTPSIIVSSPNGGEKYKVGNKVNIKWESKGTAKTDIAKIELGYTHTDPTYGAGTYFEDLIVEKTSNTGSYSWVIPEYYATGAVISSFAVKVTVAGISDYSDRKFSIVSPLKRGGITVTSPISDAGYYNGDTAKISWVSTGKDQYVVSLLKKSDPSFLRISLDTQGISPNLTWKIPGDIPIGYDYFIKVTEGLYRNKTGYSPLFAIKPNNNPQPSITVTSPNEGETWVRGTTKTIIWNDTNNVSTHEIDLISVGSVYVIANNIQGSSFNWTVGSYLSGAVPDGVYTVRVCQGSADTPCGSSNYPITITSSTTTPTAAPIVRSLSKTSASPGDLITIYGSRFYSLYTLISFSPSTFENHSPNSISSDGTSMTVFIPSDLPTGQYSITASNLVNGTWIRSTSGATLNVSATTPSITSITPSSGPVGTSVTIYGNNLANTSSNGSSNHIWFDSYSFGVTSTSVGGTSVSFVVPSYLTPGTYQVAVKTSLSLPSSNSFLFTITSPTTQPLTATCSGTPNGNLGARWGASPTGGSGSYTFQWSAYNDVTAYDGTLTSPGFSATYGSPGSKQVVARISDGRTSVSASCSTTVSAVTSTSSITVTSPNRGETYNIQKDSADGRSKVYIPITWTSSGLPTNTGLVHIKLLQGSNVIYDTGSPGTGVVGIYNMGQFNLIVEAGYYNITPGNNFKIEVYFPGDQYHPANWGDDTSDSYFTITSATTQPSITLTATPTSVTLGQPVTVAWSTTNASSCSFIPQEEDKGGDWSGYAGPVDISGSISGAVTSNTTFTITCTGPGGTASKSMTVGGNVLGAESFHFTQFLAEGSSGNEVTELQKFLSGVGYDAGNVDGKFGPKTKEALIKFQIASGLKSDGIVGYEVRTLLNK